MISTQHNFQSFSIMSLHKTSDVFLIFLYIFFHLFNDTESRERTGNPYHETAHSNPPTRTSSQDFPYC